MLKLRNFLILLIGGTALIAGSALASPEQLSFLTAPEGHISLPDLDCSIESYPQALPNDGFSEASISVELSTEGQPLAGTMLKARVVNGDGLLLRDEVETDSQGRALFAYRAGTLPQPGQIEISAESCDMQAEVSIPLAPVAYMDVLLVTPEEYRAHLQRQASAAPIYKLEASVFPGQLAADGGSMSSIKARLLNADGTAAPGVPLTAKVICGDGSVMIEQEATDSSGNFSFYFIAGFTPGSATVQIMEPSTGLTYAINILLVEAGPARVELFYIDPFNAAAGREGALLPADGNTGLPVIAQVSDLSGLPLADVELRIEILDQQNGWIELIDPATDIEGRVEFIYHAGSFTGPVRLRAFVADGMSVAPVKLSGTASSI